MKRVIFLMTSVMISCVAFSQTDTTSAMNTGVSDFPNYHPLVVHFPLVLLLAAAVMQIVVLFYRNKVFNYTIVAFTVIGFITGLLAATVFHGHASHDVNAKAMEIFEEHEKLAFITIWISGFASAIKIAGLFIQKKWIEIVALFFLLGSAITVTIAGHHGSELVYKQGIGPKGEKLEEE